MSKNRIQLDRFIPGDEEPAKQEAPADPLPIDPFNMYEVAMLSDRVLKMKRALEAAGFEVEVKTTLSVDMHMEIKGPKPAE